VKVILKGVFVHILCNIFKYCAASQVSKC